MTGFAPRSSVRRQYKPRLFAGWAEDLIGTVVLVFFVWLCVGPGIDLVLYVFGWDR